MSAGDIVAVYGAVLASALAVLQYLQWRKSSEIFAVRVYDEFCELGKSDIELSISNLTFHEVETLFAGIGIGYRPWLRPWKRRHLDIVGLRRVEEDGVGNQICLDKVRSGQMIGAYFPAKGYAEIIDGWSRKLGFDKRLCVWIEHSRDNRQICKPLT